MKISIQKVLFLVTLNVVISPAAIFADEFMQPIVRDGKYYYNDKDTYQHIDIYRAMKTLCTKMLSPQWLVTYISSFFYPQEHEVFDVEKELNPTQTVPEEFSVEPKFTWIGHATFLIQANGFNILTDPIFGDVKVGPFSLTKRSMRPGVTLENLPPIDVIVISHNHSDHTDTPALTYLAEKYDPVVYVPMGNKELIESMGFSRVIENTWWETNEPLSKEGKTLTITCLPAYHWSIRFSLSGYRQALWSSWMLSTHDTNFYFAGDTAYGEHFRQIAQRFSSIDVAFLPIAPTCKGENKHKLYHVDALEAVDAFIDLKARCFVPMHYGTFFLSKQTITYPLQRLNEYWDEKSADLQQAHLLRARCGQSYERTEWTSTGSSI